MHHWGCSPVSNTQHQLQKPVNILETERQAEKVAAKNQQPATSNLPELRTQLRQPASDSRCASPTVTQELMKLNRTQGKTTASTQGTQPFHKGKFTRFTHLENLYHIIRGSTGLSFTVPLSSGLHLKLTFKT